MIRKLTTLIVICFVSVNALFLAGVSLMSYKIFFDFTSGEISETRLTLLNESVSGAANFITSVSEAGIYIAANRSMLERFSDKPANDYEAILEQRELMDLIGGVSSFRRAIHSIEVFTDRYLNLPPMADSTIYPIQHIEQESWFTLFDSMDSGWLPEHRSPIDGNEMLSYVHRLMNMQGLTVGYVKVNVLTSRFFEFITDEQHDESSDETFLLLNAGGRVIGQSSLPEQAGILTQITEEHELEPYLVLNSEFSDLTNHHEVVRSGNDLYLLLISKPNYDRWRLVQVLPVDSLYAKTRELGWFVMVLGVCGLILSIPLVYFVSRKIIVPISKIIQGMKQVEIGDFDVRMSRHYIEEYDVLARHFNHMTSELEQSVKQLATENKARREAELRSLQSQIMPHFLYNTLDLIHWKAMDHKAEDISFMVNELGRMFRISLSGGQKFIMLRDELEHANCYINIQKARLNKPIEYIVNASVKVKTLFVPKIILQPFIENSMIHGFQPFTDQTITISVHAEMKNNATLEIIIMDNGKGLPKDWDPKHSQGIGIRNVQERIWLYCGEIYGAQLFNHEEGGAAVKISLPLIRNRTELDQWLAQSEEWLGGMERK